jgi:RNA polymerase sigma-54 factor
MQKLSLTQKLQQKLSPQQIQLAKLLQVPTVALEQRIKEELELNPALEEGAEEDEEFNNEEEEGSEDEIDPIEDVDGETEDIQKEKEDFDIDEYLQDDDLPYYKLNANNSSKDDERVEMPVVVGTSFHDSLYAQLGMTDLDERKTQIAENLIGNLDDDGYLRRPLNSIADDLSFTQNINAGEKELEEILFVIQGFEPAGVGARNLRECLLLQLQRKDQDDPFISTATLIVEKYMEEFSKKHYDKIAKHFEIGEEALKDVIHEILKLNPKPGDTVSDIQKSQQHITPDFLIYNGDGVLELMLNSKNAPELRVSRTYMDILQNYSKEKKSTKSSKDAMMFVKQKLDSARWFIDAIKQRQQTLLKSMTAIMQHQNEYFLSGDETKLKPMILKDIADKVGLDISTISRVANSKYVQTPFGTFLLKSFFSEALQTESGEEVSSREVKKILSNAIEAEDKSKPLTDDKLATILKGKGYTIARRTIAKYREQLGIPVARMRKEL